MADYFQVKNQNIFNPPANTSLGNATNQFNDVYVQNDLVLGNVTVTGDTIIAPRITTITYPGNDTAADTAGGQTITLTGTGFVVGANILINGSAVGVVSVVSSTTITFTSPANATGSYVIYVINPDGSTAIAIPGIQYSGTPNWTTAAGTLGNVYETASFNQTVTATGDAPITYSVTTGTLPPGATFNSNGTISGTSQLLSSPTTYSFTVRATDAQLQDTDRAFSIAVIPDVVTWSSPSNNATYTPAANIAMANITLSATSAVGSGITYSANTLPTGLSLTGANILGTPTVVANTSSLLTATANTTSESSSITINWVVSVASDPYFMYNSLLLPGNGSNGAQNNTFLDGSTNNLAITRNGNTTQGTFSPYGVNWSNYFNGTDAYLNIAQNAAFGFGTGDLTMECWVYPVAWNSAIDGFLSCMIGAGAASGIQISRDGVEYGLNSSSANLITWTNAIQLNTWTHLAVSRSGTTMRTFVNGVLDKTNTVSQDLTSSRACTVGRRLTDFAGYYMNGYVSNARVVKGAAVYTSTFIPSTIPLTAIANTSLLTCQSNRFIDNSTNAFAITVVGNTNVQRYSPFSPGSVYSAGTIGGSGYFDGSDWLTSSSSSALDISTGDWTVQSWYYPTAYSAGNNVMLYIGASAGDKIVIATLGTGGVLSYLLNGSVVISTSASAPLNAWAFIALVKSGGTTTLYLNGVSIGTTSSVPTSSSKSAVIGTDAGGAVYQGYFSDTRVLKGTANTTVPTAPLTAIANTSLLLNYTNAGIIDNTMLNNLETVGNAQISTAQTKFGSGSMYFDGTGDYLTSPNSLLAIQGSRAFTLEAWIYPTSVAGDLCIYDTRGGGSGFVFFINSTGKLQVFDSVAALQTQSTTTLTANTWTFISMVRATGSSTVTYYVDGTAAGTFSLASFATATQTRIGARYDAAAAYVGYIDDFRITNGYARYTSNFTPPTSAFPTY
jgi:hypothetical protein